jgi:hypothetical protein
MYGRLEFILALKEAYVLPALRRVCYSRRSIRLMVLFGLSRLSVTGTICIYIIRCIRPADTPGSLRGARPEGCSFDAILYRTVSQSLLVGLARSVSATHRNRRLLSHDFVVVLNPKSLSCVVSQQSRPRAKINRKVGMWDTLFLPYDLLSEL